MIATSPSSSCRPATTSSNVESSPCWNVGCATHAPSWCARRTAPIGPSNGMPDTVSAADAPLIDTMSCGFSRSTPRIVAMTCTSLRKSDGNDGRRGRSVRRAVRIASSPGRPSRRKNGPGISPAAYARSSTSTVRGKKSSPSRGLLVATVDSTVVPPTFTTTAPAASAASCPVSSVISSPSALIGPETETASLTRRFLSVMREASVPSCQRRKLLHMQELRALATDNRQPSRRLLRNVKRGADVRSSHESLSTDAELGDERPVPLDVVASEVVEHSPTAADEHQESTLRVKVLLVDLPVLRQVADALGEECDLHFGGAGVSVGSAMFADRCGLVGHARVQAFSFDTDSAEKATRRAAPPPWSARRSQLAHPIDVPVHLGDEVVDRVEANLAAEVVREPDPRLLVVEVAVEVEDIRLTQAEPGLGVERRPPADRDRGGPHDAVRGAERSRVDPVGGKADVLGHAHIGGRERQLTPARVAVLDLAPDLVRST